MRERDEALLMRNTVTNTQHTTHDTHNMPGTKCLEDRLDSITMELEEKQEIIRQFLDKKVS